MIEREFILQKTKEFYIKQYIEGELKGAGISQIRLKKIPLGEKIIIHTNRPSLIVGSKGSNIRALTKTLKNKFKLENPQIEITEVKEIFLDASIVASRIANSLERFGSARFKGVGHKIMENVLNSGALGVELIISGKIPGARARSWRFYQGYLKKCGDVAFSGVRHAQTSALLKSGIVGIKVAIMPPDIVLPDSIEILDEPIQIVEELPEKKATKKPAKKRKKSTSAKPKMAKTETIETKTAESQSSKPQIAEQEEVAKSDSEPIKQEAPESQESPADTTTASESIEKVPTPQESIQSKESESKDENN
jgi:small subunit ribosomal protein S3